MRLPATAATFLLTLLTTSDVLLAGSNSCKTLYLLHAAPKYTPEEDGWDKGLQMIPAGHLAARHVNDHPDVLSGLELDIVDIPTEPCGVTSPYTSYVEIMSKLISSQQRCVFGVIGLYCSNVANIIVPPLSHPQFGYLQLTSATSPLLRDTHSYPFLFSITESSLAYNIATVKMMEQLKWRRISVAFDYPHFFFRSTGTSFSQLLESNSNLMSVTEVPIAADKMAEDIQLLFDRLLQKASRITYLSVTIEESGRIMCEAYRRKLIWPWNVYIFVDRTLSEVLSQPGGCSPEEIKEAAEGIFFLQSSLSASRDSLLVSGVTFQEFDFMYQEALKKASEKIGRELTGDVYANTLYDQVWSIALALNYSLDDLNFTINGSFENVIKGIPMNRMVLHKAMQQVSFQGASGTVSFDERHEVPTMVTILQVRNGSTSSIGIYYSNNETIMFYSNFDTTDVPPDSFTIKYYTIHGGIAAILLLLQVFFLFLVIGSAVIMIYWRGHPKVKSSSVNISFVILAGCLLLCSSPLIHTILNTTYTTPSVYSFFCTLELWLSFYGLTLILASLLFRLLRIDHVFRSYRSTGKYWSDSYLLLYIFVSSLGILLLLLLWEGSNPIYAVSEVVYQSSAVPPYFLEHRHCSSDQFGIWLVICLSWIALLDVVVVFLAIQTRKIEREDFKDTKKVNAFIYSTAFVFVFFIPLSHIFQAAGYVLLSFLFFCFSYFSIVLLCEVFLFFPKCVPLLYLKCIQIYKIRCANTTRA